ncbi:DUF2182 domain-containing protein [uncultured Massilia sp.]|uniref:DUF2182 domain-containing protein n=1 Tax=uncultured Massilia sp. TaxID=169973 RepID=UPI0025D76728|nr:DUF2182 domain-containing protein [uncultured Massilia sp.]
MNATGIRRAGGARTVAFVLPGLLAAACCAYLLLRAGHPAPAAAAGAARTLPAPWRGADLALLFALWAVVIGATMLPAAAPSVLLYARARRMRGGRWVAPASALFVLGSLCVWSACAAAATLAAWLLHDAGALDEAMAVSHPSALALALVAAGVYQWTPAKHACLDHCRTPPRTSLAVVLAHWRRGARGALRMGAADARHGIGCCWLLLVLALPGGVLNLPVVGGLVALILAEKLLPGGHVIACATGLGLVALGTMLLFP